MMKQDYYQILGVKPNADTQVIAKAYRKLVRDYHPERGESPDRIALVNKAWKILSDPKLRQQYDGARSNRANANDRSKAETETQLPRQRTEQHPQRWIVFSAILNAVKQDFANAEFRPMWGSGFAAAGNSWSGWLFIFIGSFLSGVFFAIAKLVVEKNFPSLISHMDVSPYKNILRFLMIISCFAGGWIGAAIHQKIDEII